MESLPAVPVTQTFLAYAQGGFAEFVELTNDGRRTLEAIAEAGSLGALIEAHGPLSAAAEARLLEFGAKLFQLGLLAGDGAPRPALQPLS
jgi:hypothetical protein